MSSGPGFHSVNRSLMTVDRRTALLARLDDIGASLATTDTALALIGLGSVGRELERLDDYSDLDFFVVVDPEHKNDFLESLTWLSAVHPLAYRFRNSPDGYKFLFEDGVYGEMAVFSLDELRRAAYTPGRLVWQRGDVDETITTPPNWPPPQEEPSADWLLGEALTNLYVGLCRYRRGEKLSAFRFIQQFAVDRVLALSHLIESAGVDEADPFDPPRRFEQRYPSLAVNLPALMQGYDRSPESAAAILTLLQHHFPIDQAMEKEIKKLLKVP
jgi:lincosamide nucleotidyltransferase B/F